MQPCTSIYKNHEIHSCILTLPKDSKVLLLQIKLIEASSIAMSQLTAS